MNLLLAGLLTVGISTVLADPNSAKESESRISIQFIEPENFSDAGDRYRSTKERRDYTLKQLAKTIRKTAEKYISKGMKLEIKVTEVDLAGDFEPWRGIDFYDIRIVKDLYPPRIDLEYKLIDADGNILKAESKRLRDPSFLFGATPLRTDTLRHDKVLLRRWIRTEFKNSHNS